GVTMFTRRSVHCADRMTATSSWNGETADGIMRLLTKINREDGTAIVMVTHNRAIFEKYHGRVFVCKDETCEENIDNEVIDLALTI
ncbi:MAG: hypothetical protein IJM60_06265, partial [Bacteroidales bacterium]|nr:hypothetical protein [Bacteroidales bacterium]